MADRLRSSRGPARYLAPLALAATIAGIYLVAESALNSSSKPRSTSASKPRSSHRVAHPVHRVAPRRTAPARTTVRGSFYTVRAGDTPSVIAARTGVSVATLLSLNPGVSATSLQIGQRLRLRR